MNDFFNSGNKKAEFNIIKKKDSTDGHGGFGAGSFSLDNMSPVFVDPKDEEAFIDIGAMHARSKVEKGIKFLSDKNEVPNGKLYWLVWVTIFQGEKGPYYGGLGACDMLVDREARRGYKMLPVHVNNMDRSRKGRIIVDEMDEKSKKILVDFLKKYNEEFWENSSDELKEALSAK
jgi:hypothetical protein